MNKIFIRLLICSSLLAVAGIKPALADSANLNDGIVCVAGKKGGYYFYTSTIDDSSIKLKQPVSLTILQKQVTVGENDLVIIDKSKKTVTLTDFETETISNPESQVVDTATASLNGKNIFVGKTKKNSPISFALSKDYSKIKINFAGKIYSGKCQ